VQLAPSRAVGFDLPLDTSGYWPSWRCAYLRPGANTNKNAFHSQAIVLH